MAIHDRQGVIYALTAPNGKRYVGQTVNYANRLRNHKWEAYTQKTEGKLYNSVRKYGWPNFKKKVIWKCKQSELDHYEVLLIEQYGTQKNGLNIDIGGKGRKGYKRKASSNRQQSESMLKKTRSGCIQRTPSSRWQCCIQVAGETHRLGTYDTREEAAAVIGLFKLRNGW